ncbi:uncharacterized protein LOC128723606 [Anopheles nili]|uniref:uncharacterized protein LOC128723606 n=1 Tax=Anopheles nili TaxID=185578 RepID=UPI00237C2EB1|nr:uncharacterized protein LOC128723606 [Anopheles nili]
MVLNEVPGESAHETVCNTFRNCSPTVESYSLTILIKLLKLNDPSPDKRYELSLQCGGECVSDFGTLAELNGKKIGNVVGLMANKDQFLRFLNDGSVKVRIKHNNASVCEGLLKLKDTKIMRFDPSFDGGDLIEEEFPVLDGATEMGMVSMVLRAERNTLSGQSPYTEGFSEEGFAKSDVLFEINKDRKGSDADNAIRPELLVCPTCNVFRVSEEISCEYELCDGILKKKAISVTEKMIEDIKEKVKHVRLDETIGHRESCSQSGSYQSQNICKVCHGKTITGASCPVQEDFRSDLQEQAPRTLCTDSLFKPNTTPHSPKMFNRCCERCKACLDWLPLVSCCPKCGLKPEPPKIASKPSQRPFYDSSTDAKPSANTTSPSLKGSDTMIASSQSCPICQIRQNRCVDCAKQIHNMRNQSSVTSSSTPLCLKMKSLNLPRSERPVTRRPPLTARRSSVANQQPVELEQSSQSKRTEQLRNAYMGNETRDSKVCPPSTANSKGRLSSAKIRQNHNAFLRKVKRQNRNLYSYRFGKRHPGMVMGHRNCMKQKPLVPAHMGWQWDICPPGIDKRRPGWRPGAVRKPIMQLMQHFLKCYPLDNVPVSTKKSVTFRGTDQGQDGEHQARGQKPTLHITKKHGEYQITMNPLKDSETLQTTDDPYLPCKPIKFKLAKDPQRTKLYMLRDALKRKGLPLCGCKDLASCEHCTDREKRLLVEEVRRTAKVLGLAAQTTVADVPSGSESELDVEFTPPSAILRPDMRRPDVVVAETQYNVQDFQLKPMPAETSSKGSKGKGPGRGGALAHGKGDAGSSKTVAAKGAAGKKPTGGAPDANVRISVSKGKGQAGKAKGNEAAGKGGKNTPGSSQRPSQGQQGRPGQGGAAIGEGASGGTNQRSTKGQNTGNSNSTKVNVQQRSALSRGTAAGLGTGLVCRQVAGGPQPPPMPTICCPVFTYDCCSYPTQCLP